MAHSAALFNKEFPEGLAPFRAKKQSAFLKEAQSKIVSQGSE
jgi:hypothetical protein